MGKNVMNSWRNLFLALGIITYFDTGNSCLWDWWTIGHLHMQGLLVGSVTDTYGFYVASGTYLLSYQILISVVMKPPYKR